MRLTSESPFIWVIIKPYLPNLTCPRTEWLFLMCKCLFLTSECLFLTSECLFLTSECFFLMSECLFLTSGSLFLTSECLFLMSESPFIWVYNENYLPNLTCPRAYSQRPSAYSQPEGKGLLRGPLMSIFFKVTTNFEHLYKWSV